MAASLQEAKKAKNDEFYTQIGDIENELSHYKHHFKGKTVFCNCDDPYESNFFKYFALNFNSFELKKLICTCWDGSPITGKELEPISIKRDKEGRSRIAYKVEITEVKDLTGDGATGLEDVKLLLQRNKPTLLKQHGDFRSEECIQLLEEADIVVTNPPFSLFREYVVQLMNNEKKFLIIGNKNAITYKEIFPLIKENKIWVGVTPMTKDMHFFIPSQYVSELLDNNRSTAIAKEGENILGRSPSIWFTNLDHNKRHLPMDLYKNYTSEEYPKYDNYDAINVDKTAEIPQDYDGVMGVPISFLDKYCPDQFEIVGLTSGRNEFDKIAWPTKRYINPMQINKDGSVTNGSKANTRATILLDDIPNDIYYTANNASKPFQIMYARILIRKKPESL